jgi:hypothetical protein
MAGLVGGDGAVCTAKGFSGGQLTPTRNYVVCPLAVPGPHSNAWLVLDSYACFSFRTRARNRSQRGNTGSSAKTPPVEGSGLGLIV